MTHVLNVVAAKAKAVLDTGEIDRLARQGAQFGVRFGQPIWLSPDEAVDIPFAGDPAAALAATRAHFAGRAYDINILPEASRRKLLLVADMDSTMIEQECIDELAATIGIGDAVSSITERAMRGEIAFEPALLERVKLLAGLEISTAEAVLSSRVTPMPGARTLVATMRAAGATCALVSGGFTFFAEPIAKMLNFTEFRANTLLTEGKVFSGEVAQPILGQQAKADALAELTARLRIDPLATLVVGDGANDIAMIRGAGLGVAFRAKPALRAMADAVIDHADLTALLFLQGYRRDEFVAS